MLNEREQEILDGLQDPDQYSEEEAHYAWDEDFQRVILGMLLSDRFFINQSLGLIKPNYFTNEVHQLISRILFEYFEKNRQQPSKIFVKQEILDRLRARYENSEETYDSMRILYAGEINTVYDYFSRGGIGDVVPGLDSPEAILDKIVAFSKTQAMKQAFFKSLELIKKNPQSDVTWSKVNEFIKEAQLIDRQSDIGLEYYQSIDERYLRMQQEKESAEVFTTGFRSINNGLDGEGLRRGEIGAFMGVPGTGKSLALVQAAAHNIRDGKKVLYITTEMDQDRVAKRFDAMMTMIGHDHLIGKKEEVKSALLELIDDYEDKRRLIVKQFPSGAADVHTLRAHYSQCVMYGFKPDLYIVDYVGDMKDTPGIPTWESRFRILRDLRGFGVEENHCTLTALQPTRGASELKIEDFMDESKMADSIMQHRVLDALWTINQTSKEQQAAIGRMYVAKTRNGRSKFSFHIKYGFADHTLTMTEISKDTYHASLAKIDVKNDRGTEDRVNETIGTWSPTDGERQQ